MWSTTCKGAKIIPLGGQNKTPLCSYHRALCTYHQSKWRPQTVMFVRLFCHLGPAHLTELCSPHHQSHLVQSQCCVCVFVFAACCLTRTALPVGVLSLLRLPHRPRNLTELSSAGHRSQCVHSHCCICAVFPARCPAHLTELRAPHHQSHLGHSHCCVSAISCCVSPGTSYRALLTTSSESVGALQGLCFIDVSAQAQNMS